MNISFSEKIENQITLINIEVGKTYKIEYFDNFITIKNYELYELIE